MTDSMQHKALLNVEIIETKHELLKVLSRAKLDDCLEVFQKAQQVINQSQQVLRLIDGPHPIWHMPADDTLYLDHQGLNAFELAYILTLFISTTKYSIIALDGYLADLSFYLPRLRWILSYYDCQLILLHD